MILLFLMVIIDEDDVIIKIILDRIMRMIFLNNNTFDIVDSNDGSYNGDDNDDKLKV